MRQLLLVRHAAPTIKPGVPAAEWRLSEEGRAAATALAGQLTRYSISHFVSSREPKAVETATLLAASFGKPVEEYGDLHEHERSQTPFLGREEFEVTMARFFRRRKELVLGDETAAQALRRFTVAIETVAHVSPGEGDILVVTHGTVLALFVAAHNSVEPFTFWRGLTLPDLVALRLPDYQLVEETALSQRGASYRARATEARKLRF